jgi:hypothetical protein
VQVELSDAVSIGAIVFAAGAAWITVSRTAKSAARQGVRIGALEKQLERLKGIEIGRRVPTAAAGVPIQHGEEGES